MLRSQLEQLESRTLLNGSPFTIVTLPDTQDYVKYSPEIFCAQTQWIASQVAGRNIAFVSHLGDVVTRGFRTWQMENADTAMDTIDGLVPYSVAIGNHDYEAYNNELTSHQTSANFVQWFGAARYADKTWYGGSSLDQRSHFQIFTAGGRTFLHINLEWEPYDSAIAWAQGVINAHRQLPVILTTHSYLTTAGRSTSLMSTNGGNTGEQIFQKLVRPNPQIFMVLCGHAGGEYHQVSYNDAGQPVMEIMADYTSRGDGDGWLQIINFDPAANRVSVQTYSPWLNQWETDANSQFSFDIDLNARWQAVPSGATVANDDTYTITTGGTVEGNVLANDYDSDAPALTASLVSGPAHGTLSFSSDGTFSYAAAPGFHGADSFTYTAADGDAVSNVATVTIRVNEAPVANDDSAATTEYTSVVIPVLANDADPDGDPVTIELVSTPLHGSAVRNADGTITYTPHPKYVGSDSFTYLLCDGVNNGNVATVTVTIEAGAAVFDYAVSETAVEGTVSGNYTATFVSDGVGETITEIVVNNTSSAEHRWRFNVTGGTIVTFCVNARCTPGEKWDFQYSLNGSTWTALKNLSRPVYDETEPYETFTMPAGTAGTVWVRLIDADSTAGETALQTASVDEMFFRCVPVPPTVSITASDAAAGEIGPDSGTFVVTRSGGSISRDLVVNYVLSGTAASGADYSALTGTVTIPAGSASAVFSVVPISDSLIEGSETVIATITPSASYVIGTASATITIADGPAATALTATPISSSSISLAWVDGASNETGFRIERSTNGTTFTEVAAVGANVTTYLDTGLSSATTYYYRVRGASGSVYSAYSNVVSAKTLAAAPAAPSNLVAAVIAKTKVKLTWRDNSTNENGFYVYISSDGINWTRIATVAAKSGSGGTVSYTTGSLSRGTWRFRVSAFNGDGESDFSNIATVIL